MSWYLCVLKLSVSWLTDWLIRWQLLLLLGDLLGRLLKNLYFLQLLVFELLEHRPELVLALAF